MKEEWKDIKGYEDLYQVSNLGRVKSLNYRKTGKEKILKNVKDKDGYFQIHLCKNGRAKHFKIHRLVAKTFIPNPDNLQQINHKDEDKQNNRIDNLEWCTQSYNHDYGTRNKRTAKKNKKKVKCITTNEIFNSIKEAGQNYNINSGDISRCCQGKHSYCGKLKTGEKLVWRYL